METVTDFIFLGSKITADGDCNHEIKRLLLLGKKSCDQPRQHIQKQRHYFANKGPSSQGYGFSSGHVWMWELDHKEAECRRIDAFELWCWRRLLRVPWTAGRSNQSILKEISPEYSLERLMLKLKLKLKLQYFGHLMWRTDSLEKTLMLGKIEGGRRRGRQRMRWWMASPTQWTWVWASSEVDEREAWHAAFDGIAKGWTRLSKWTDLTCFRSVMFALQIMSLNLLSYSCFPSNDYPQKFSSFSKSGLINSLPRIFSQSSYLE